MTKHNSIIRIIIRLSLLFLCFSNYAYASTITWNRGLNSFDSTYCSLSGCSMLGNLDMDGHSLTSVGELVMQGTMTSADIIPLTTNIYSLGNSSNWFNEIYVNIIYSNNIFTNSLNATDIDSTNINSENVDVGNNLSLGAYTFTKKEGNLVLILEE